MADGFFPTLVSRNENPNSSSNVLFANLSDGTDSLNINADGSLNVTVTGGAANTQFAEDTAHASGDIGTEMLAVRRDTAASGVSADGDYATLNVDSTGRLWCNVSNTVTVSATDLDIRDLTSGSDSVSAVQSGTWNIGTVSTITNPVTVTATNLDIRDLAFATDKVDASGTTLGANSGVDIGDVTINNAAGASAVNIQDGGNSLTVDATDLDIRDITRATDSIQVSANTAANSATNPIFVQQVSSNISGEVHNYDTAPAVAGGATDNHDYTVTTALRLTSIIASASGACKIEVQTGPVASLVTRAVGFIEKSGGTLQLKFDPPIEVPTTSTGTVRLIRTNREGSAQDLYSTIIGIDA